MQSAPLERRGHARVHVILPIELRHERGFALHSTCDLSATGAFFDRAIPFPLGARLEVSFALPGTEQAICCQGEVVNVPDAAGYGMGVRFEGLGDDDLAALKAFTRDLNDREDTE